jgi:hypothetical protein
MNSLSRSKSIITLEDFELTKKLLKKAEVYAAKDSHALAITFNNYGCFF